MTDTIDTVWTRDRILADILAILQEKVRKLDAEFAGDLNETTRIVADLNFESVTIVEFCMAIGKHFRKKLPFQELVFRNGRFQDFSVGELLAFVERQLAG